VSQARSCFLGSGLEPFCVRGRRRSLCVPRTIRGRSFGSPSLLNLSESGKSQGKVRRVCMLHESSRRVAGVACILTIEFVCLRRSEADIGVGFARTCPRMSHSDPLPMYQPLEHLFVEDRQRVGSAGCFSGWPPDRPELPGKRGGIRGGSGCVPVCVPAAGAVAAAFPLNDGGLGGAPVFLRLRLGLRDHPAPSFDVWRDRVITYHGSAKGKRKKREHGCEAVA
jgi:hypothetical protein